MSSTNKLKFPNRLERKNKVPGTVNFVPVTQLFNAIKLCHMPGFLSRSLASIMLKISPVPYHTTLSLDKLR